MADADVTAAAAAAPDPAASGWKAWVLTKARSTFNSLITKDYEVDDVRKTPKQIEGSRRLKLKGYVAICMIGLGTMHWGGAEKVLNHISEGNDQALANTCVQFLTFAFSCSLLGVTAGTFPSTAPWPLFFAGLGAWQSCLFVLAFFHLETRKYYQEEDNVAYSFYISAFWFSLYWSQAAQDPLILHAFGKALVFSVRSLFFFIRWIWMSKGDLGTMLWKALCSSPNPRNILPRFRINRRRDS